eukprot:PhM_4_TR738/c0_g1_i2/m.100043
MFAMFVKLVCAGLLLVELEVRVGFLHVHLVALLEVPLQNNVAVAAHSLHARLLAHGRDLGAGELVRPRDEVLQIDLLGQVHLRRGDLEDEALRAAVGQRELDLAVEAAGAQQRGVERVPPVRGHDDLDVVGLVEAVHLVQELNKNALHLTVGTRLRVEALRRDGVDLVDEHNRWGVLARQAEHVADHAGPLAEVLLHELAADDADERGGGVVGNGLREHRLARARGSVQQHTARWVDADLTVELGVGQWQLDGLADLLLLDVEATDVGVRNVGLFGLWEHAHVAVGLWGQDGNAGAAGAVEPDGRVGLELLPVEHGQHTHEGGAAVGGHDGAVVVDHLHELPDDEGHGLDALNLRLGGDLLDHELVDLRPRHHRAQIDVADELREALALHVLGGVHVLRRRGAHGLQLWADGGGHELFLFLYGGEIGM